MARALVRRLQHIGVERARLLHGGKMRLGELDGGEFSSAKAVARVRERQRREIGHSSGLSQANALGGGIDTLRFGRLLALGAAPPARGFRQRQSHRLQILRRHARRHLAAGEEFRAPQAEEVFLFFTGEAHWRFSLCRDRQRRAGRARLAHYGLDPEDRARSRSNSRLGT